MMQKDTIKLNKNEKELLSSMGYAEKEIKQIEEFLQQITFALFRTEDNSECSIIGYSQASKLFSKEQLLYSIVDISFFSSKTTLIVPHTMNSFYLQMDSYEAFKVQTSPSWVINTLDTYENETFFEVEKQRATPTLYAIDVEWDFDEDELIEAFQSSELNSPLMEDYYSKETLSLDEELLRSDFHHNRIPDALLKEIGFPPCKIMIPSTISMDVSYYEEDISNYLSDEFGFCHKGFLLKSNYSSSELKKMIENFTHSSDKMNPLAADAAQDSFNQWKQLDAILELEKVRDSQDFLSERE